jgi:hypothetical protein
VPGPAQLRQGQSAQRQTRPMLYRLSRFVLGGSCESLTERHSRIRPFAYKQKTKKTKTVLEQLTRSVLKSPTHKFVQNIDYVKSKHRHNIHMSLRLGKTDDFLPVCDTTPTHICACLVDGTHSPAPPNPLHTELRSSNAGLGLGHLPVTLSPRNGNVRSYPVQLRPHGRHGRCVCMTR